MSQYKLIVNVTAASQAVIVAGVDATAEIGQGDLFGVVGDFVWYDVASVSYSAPDTTVNLSANYQGATATGAQGVVVRDFTSPDSIPYPGPQDIETASLFKRAVSILQTLISEVGGAVLAKDVAGGANVTLTAAEARKGVLHFSGALTANISVIVPDRQRQWTVHNNTSGAYSLTVKTAAGAGVVVGQGKHAILRGDGTNVVRVTADY